jgi:hypothetical protein
LSLLFSRGGTDNIAPSSSADEGDWRCVTNDDACARDVVYTRSVSSCAGLMLPENAKELLPAIENSEQHKTRDT